ncbi:MAG: D-alanyl-D-alanine carboxypeptidase family protein [Lachnospiraceae bacterium]|nr:D-alanyl-D-alanine carboxypeptidase family protein [Lachnospiraceae bacterium]
MKRCSGCLVLILLLLWSFFSKYQCLESSTDTIKQKPDLMVTSSPVPEAALPYTKNTGDVAAKKELSLYAKSAVLMDAKSLRTLYEKEADEVLPMASTTKIMTCLMALSYGNPDDVVTISSRAASQPKVRLGVKEKEQYRLGDLLYALMLESDNDAAVAIAEHVGGSVEAFCAQMTSRAHDMGLSHTSFVTPNGLDADGHHTTARELAMLGAYAIRQKGFLEIVNTKSYTITECTTNRTHHVSNKNAFLTMYPGAIGIKTGYTSKASYCFVGAVQQNDTTLVSAVLASGWYPKKTYKWQDTKKLMDYGVKEYVPVTLLHPAVLSKTLPVTGGVKDQIHVKEQESLTVLLKKEDQVSYAIQQEKPLLAPLKKGELAAFLVISINGRAFHKVPLYTAENVKRYDFSWCLRVLGKRFLLNG